MTDEIRVECPSCESEQELPAFFIEVGSAFGLVGVSCPDCSEVIPASAIRETSEGEEDITLDGEDKEPDYAT